MPDTSTVDRSLARVAGEGDDALGTLVRSLLVLGALLVVEVGLLLAYLAKSGAEPVSIRYYAYPFVWLNAAVLVALHLQLPDADRPGLAAVGAIGYFLAVLISSGVLSRGGMGTGLDVYWLAPGWGPLIGYDGTLLSARLIPYQIVGALTLAVLFYAVLASVPRGALLGAGGLVTCVSCAWPIVGAVGGLVGVGSLAASRWSYDLATVVFLGTLVGLYWVVTVAAADRPG